MKKIIIILITLLTTNNLCAQMLAVSTDATQWAMAMPNLQTDLVVGQHSTLGVSYTFGNTTYLNPVKKMQIFQPEYRHFFSGRPLFHHFVGISAIGATYDLQWKGKEYDGDALGLGLSFGYVMKLSHRLNVDFHAGAGFVHFSHKEYLVNGDHHDDYMPEGKYKTNAKGWLSIPTKIGVSVTYIFDNYKTKNRN